MLRELARRGVHNVVWLTADVHYTAAHHYSPYRRLRPFSWSFVSGPLHAGAFGPSGQLTVTLRDGRGTALWSKTLTPQRH